MSIIKYFDKLCFTDVILKPACVTCDSEHREPSPKCATSQNSQRRRRTDQIRTQGIPLVHSRNCKGRLPLHLLSMRRETLLCNTQLKQVHLYYLEQIWSQFCPHHLTGSLKWRQTSHNTQNDPPTPTGPVFRLRRDGSGSCSVDRGWGSRGCKRPSCHFGQLPL